MWQIFVSSRLMMWQDIYALFIVRRFMPYGPGFWHLNKIDAFPRGRSEFKWVRTSRTVSMALGFLEQTYDFGHGLSDPMVLDDISGEFPSSVLSLHVYKFGL
jgi:hypothetical protein